MKIPNSVNFIVSCGCHECNKVIEIECLSSRAAAASKGLRILLEKEGWVPLMLGTDCLGVYCNECANAAFAIDESEDDDDDCETDEDADEDEDATEALPDPLPTSG